METKGLIASKLLVVLWMVICYYNLGYLGYLFVSGVSMVGYHLDHLLNFQAESHIEHPNELM